MPSTYSKICVTGGAGFIGSHLVDRLLDDGHEVIAIDNLSSGKLENVKRNFGRKGFLFVNCDIRNNESAKSLFKDVDVVFHEAAATKRILKPTLTNSINVSGTLNLLEAVIRSNVKRFIFASSAAVYGDQSVPQREDMPTKPISPYGVSKLTAENYVKVFQEAYGLETVCLRYFNVYGPRQARNSPYSGVISKFIERLLSNKTLIIYGDGCQSRDFIHVKDVVEANLLALKNENENTIGEIFNVGTGRSTSINELAEMLMKIRNKNNAMPVHTKEKIGDIKYSQADTTKTKEVLAFTHRYLLENELPKLVQWYKMHCPPNRFV